MRRASLAAVLCWFAATSTAAQAQSVPVAQGHYSEGLLWHGGRMLFAEMGADRVSVIEGNAVRPLWSERGCGPTSVAPFGPGFLVNCHLGKALVEVTASGATGRRFGQAAGGPSVGDPNASAGDGRGGVYVSDSGTFSLKASATGRVIHLAFDGTMTEVTAGLRYANGVAFDPASRTLYVSEHLARRIHALTLDAGHRVTARRVLVDFASLPNARSYTYPEAGPDGLALRPGLIAAAEYGEGRVHLFDRDGRHRRTLPVPMRFVDTVAWDVAGNLYAGGAFQNLRPPFEGLVVRFRPADWQAR